VRPTALFSPLPRRAIDREAHAGYRRSRKETLPPRGQGIRKEQCGFSFSERVIYNTAFSLPGKLRPQPKVAGFLLARRHFLRRRPPGCAGVRRQPQRRGCIVRGLGRAGRPRIRYVQVFVPVDGVHPPVMGLAAYACGDGYNGEGGTECGMHKSGRIIAACAPCARRGIWKRSIKMPGLRPASHPATNLRRSEPRFRRLVLK